MNEQDFIHNIDKKTKDLNIPKSVSPEAMKERLDKAYREHPKANTPLSANAGTHRFKGAAIAACIVLCLFGTAGVIKLSQTDKMDTTNSYVADNSDSQADTESAEEETEPSFDRDLAFQTGLISPKSYEDYYSDIKEAYDKYYDSISTVETNISGDAEIEAAEDSADRATGAATATQKQDSLYDSGQAEATQNAAKDLSDTSTAKGADHSDTNTQEKNVDEGDLIKTDGKYIYKAVTKYDNQTGEDTTTLSITKAEKGKLTHMSTLTFQTSEYNNSDLSRTKDLEEFYVKDNKLILLFGKNEFQEESTSSTSIEIYDVSDKKNPKKVKVLSQSGSLLSSRISNGYLYTVSSYNDMDFSDKALYENYIPSVNGKTIACNKIYYPKDSMLNSSKVITSLKLSDINDFTDSITIPGNSSQIYVSEQAIYFYDTVYDSVTKTKISKVLYKDGTFTVGHSAVIAGYLYGPFAINEYKDHLRIVATIPANNISLLRSLSTDTAVNDMAEDVNALYILDNNLNLTGRITGIAPGEIIYSARFMGDTGYFVTYKNTDPLFSVDLSDPENPEIIGSLKIPGFSNYMHFYGDNTLLGIGEETDPETQEFLGLKLSMFDISDPANVTEKDKQILKNAQYSEALYNYKAIMIDPAKNIFGFGYWSYDNSTNDNYYYSTFAYDKTYGFIETACYQLPNNAYNTDSIRGIYIGEYFYLTTDTTITSYKIGSEEVIDIVILQ